MTNPSKETLFALITRGYSFGAISRELQIPKWALRKLLQEYALPTPLAYARSFLTKQHLQQAIDEGKTLKEIAKQCRCKIAVVLTQLKKYGLKTQGQQKIDYLTEIKGKDLNPITKGVLIGALLGDSWIQYIGEATHYVFNIQHCEAQKEYAEFKAKTVMPELFLSDVFTVPWRGEGKEPFRQTSYKYCSISHPYIAWLYHQAYASGKKEVTRELLDDFTILGAAIWFGDDGSSFLREKTYVYCTNSFSLDSLKLLREWLYDNLQIKTTPIPSSSGSSQYLLRIARDSVEQFERTIGAFVKELPGVSYKYKGFVIENPQRLHVEETLKRLKIQSELLCKKESEAEMTSPL